MCVIFFLSFFFKLRFLSPAAMYEIYLVLSCSSPKVYSGIHFRLTFCWWNILTHTHIYIFVKGGTWTCMSYSLFHFHFPYQINLVSLGHVRMLCKKLCVRERGERVYTSDSRKSKSRRGDNCLSFLLSVKTPDLFFSFHPFLNSF